MAETDGTFPPGRWRGRWIWSGRVPISVSGSRPVRDPDAIDRFALFRRRFDLDVVPSFVPLRVTADSRYVLFVNGHEASRGPVRSNPRRLRYDFLDIAPLLMPGANAIAAVVRFYGRATPWWMPAPATFTLGAGSFVCEARIGDEWIASDSSWRTLEPEAWRRTPEATGIGAELAEAFDARALEAGWRAVTYDDGDWPAATELPAMYVGGTGRGEPPSDPYGPLLPRPIPALVGEERQATMVAKYTAASATAQPDPVQQVESDEDEAQPADLGDPIAAAGAVTLVTFDFGEVVSGTARLEIEAPAGACIDASGAETLRDDGRLLRLGQRSGFRYIARGSDDEFETFDPMGWRYLKLAVRSPGGPVTINRVATKERLYPRPDGPFFACSDPGLDRIYEVGLRTVDLNSHDAYLDCPTREQRAWTGDSVVHQQVHLATNPDWGLARWHPQLTASPRPDGMLPMAVAGDIELTDFAFIPDWPLHWIRSVHNLYRYTGDTELVSSLIPTVEGVLRWFEAFQGRDGLLCDVTGWCLIDWASVYSTGCSGAMNALWARGLRDLVEMAKWLGDERSSGWAQQRWNQVAQAFDAFWDPHRGLYVDHIVDGERQAPASQHVGAAALCAGLVSAERVGTVVEMLVDRKRHIRHSWHMMAMAAEDPAATLFFVRGYPPPTWDTDNLVVAAEPFFRYLVHDALHVAGRHELVADACRDWQVFLDAGETTWPETWHGGTHCHGWCSTPTRDLITYTLGIRPALPGFERVLVAPRLGDLKWVKGAAPTPRGLVRVEATREDVFIDSPVPIDLDLGTGRVDALDAGEHRVKIP